MPEETRKEGVPFPTRLSMLRFFLKGSKRCFVWSMLSACIVSLLDMLNPRIMIFTVDSVIGNRKPDLPEWFPGPAGGADLVSCLRARPYLIAAAVLLIALAAALFRYLFRLMNEIAAQRLVKRMRDTLYGRIQRLTYEWHGRNSTGDIIQRCTSDVETIRVFLSEQLTSFVRIVVLIALAVGFMAGIDVRMALIGSLFIPVVIGYSLFFYSRIGNAFERADSEEGRLSAIAQENLTGVRVVRAFGRESYERARFRGQNEYYTGFWIHLMKLLTLNWVAGDTMTGLQFLLVMLTGSVFCVRGRITPGEFIAFVSYNSMLTWPVRSLGRVITEMSKAGISVDRLRYIMNSETERDAPGAKTPPMDRDICFSHVSFSYENAAGEALTDVSLTIPAGSTVGILGGTGSGKSTLMYLLAGLYPVSSGSITIGGVDIREIKKSWLRRHIGMVLQEPYLFSRTLGENIRIAAPGADGRDMADAAEAADLLETIARFPEKYDTFVGERGVTLSGGQKQRTAIAQMLIRKSPVMIFDDSLSAVDAETDARIREALKTRTGDATVILIAHRITTLMDADRIFVLENGRVTESGTHAELLQRDGIYRKTCDMQLRAGVDS
ncbi:MAG: ABC transporter ATP-binding protein [Lachnospiraceae bacterium]|nr:ABC transporter ATP-binding protein [Lachnospiraceae bacterium]